MSITVIKPDALRIHLKVHTPANGLCLTDDLTAPVVVAIDPNQVDVHQRATIRIYYPHGHRPEIFRAPPL